MQARGSVTGLEIWHTQSDPDPNVTHNGLEHPISGLGITWQPGQLALHPGPKGQFSVARWTVTKTGEYRIEGIFQGIAQSATTDVHVLHNGEVLFDGAINIGGQQNESHFSIARSLAAGDQVDFVVGMGNGSYGGDTTALAAQLLMAGHVLADAAADFCVTDNPHGNWQYGALAAGPAPNAKTFVCYAVGKKEGTIDQFGTLSNPGSNQWEDVLSDQHPYQRVPHTASVIDFLRTVNGGAHPVFVSEYGVGSAVDLWRVTRHYEQLGKEHVEDAQFYRDKLDRFLADWKRWRMDECFTDPGDFFTQSMRQMAAERLYGLNALRANPHLVGHSVTGTVDQGMSGEGLFTTFRELKPGTVDAMFDAWAPLRLCLFAKPVNVYRGEAVKLEAVLANEDVLRPGEYPIRLTVVGPHLQRVFDTTVKVKVPSSDGDREPPFAVPIFSQELKLDMPAGKYEFLATAQQGAAPAGGRAVFFVDDPAVMPDVENEIVLWGDDPPLRQWLDKHHIRNRPFAAGTPDTREVILVGTTAPAGGSQAWKQLVERSARGASIVFLSPQVFRDGDHSTRWLPLPNKGVYRRMMGWLYHEDQWAKRHAVFVGLPCGGLMDYAFYREMIANEVFVGLDPPCQAIAGANDCSFDYSAGLIVAQYRLGAGQFLLNTLLICENLGRNPVAERLLRNMLRYAAADIEKPTEPLPEDFAATLKELGY